MPSNQTLQQIDDLDEALAWMQLLGVEVGPARLAAYRKMAEKWDDFVGGRGRLGVRELAPIIGTFAYEVTALIAIHRAFGTGARNELGELIAQLNLAIGGPIRIDAALPAREALFTALTAAYFQHAVGEVMFNGDGGAGFALGRHHIHLATRRLPPEGSIAASVSAACAQLAAALDGRTGPRSRGLVALDVSTLTTPHGQAPPTQAREAMDGAADQLLAECIDAQMNELQNGLRGMDRRIIGIMLLSSNVAVADDDRAFVPVDRWVLVWREHINISDFDLLDRLRSLLRGER